MSAYEEDLYEDLAYEDIEGASDLYDEYDEYEDYDDYDDYDEYDDSDMFAESEFDEFDEFEFDEYDSYDEFDGYDYDDYDEFDEYGEDEMDEMFAYALGAEDTDEFFKRLFRGVKKIAKKALPVLKKVGKGIGSVARVAGPVLSSIPHPYAQIGGRVASVLGKLMADAASEDEVLDAMAEYAAVDSRAIPVVATLAARSLVKNKGARMSKSARKKVVKQMNAAAKTLVAAKGKKAIRVLPRVVKSVKRKTAARPVPSSVKPKIVRRTVAKVVRKPAVVKKLSRPKAAAARKVRRAVRDTKYRSRGL